MATNVSWDDDPQPVPSTRCWIVFARVNLPPADGGGTWAAGVHMSHHEALQKAQSAAGALAFRYTESDARSAGCGVWHGPSYVVHRDNARWAVWIEAHGGEA